jgi:hypothetical protein
MKACKELNGGTCPQCISFYQAGNCQDSVSFSASSSSSSSSSSPSSNSTYNANANGKSGLFSVNLVFYYVLGGVLLVGAATAAMMRHRVRNIKNKTQGFLLQRRSLPSFPLFAF